MDARAAAGKGSKGTLPHCVLARVLTAEGLHACMAMGPGDQREPGSEHSRESFLVGGSGVWDSDDEGETGDLKNMNGTV